MSRPVPQWEQLPGHARADLAPRDYDADWFARHAQDPARRLTVLTLYVKLRGLDLWQHVRIESGGELGCLHFVCADLASFKATLRGRGDFTNPADGDEAWDSRERRAEGALHFKHFSGWPRDKIQAHIDPEGLHLCDRAWWLLPIVPLTQMLVHAADPTGYRDVERIRELLLHQGWDPASLLGA